MFFINSHLKSDRYFWTLWSVWSIYYFFFMHLQEESENYISLSCAGFGDVSWNNPEIITPKMQALADEGIILDYNYVHAICSPWVNHYSILLSHHEKLIFSLLNANYWNHYMSKEKITQSLYMVSRHGPFWKSLSWIERVHFDIVLS